MKTYQDTYPSEPLLRASDLVRPKAAALLNLEFFEAEPAYMAPNIYDQHHILVNLKPAPHRVEHWRDGEYRDFTLMPNEIIVTPAGVKSGWRWHETSKVIVVTLNPERLEAFAKSEVGILLTEQQLQDLPQFEDADIVTAATMLLNALKLGGTGSDVMFESLARVFLIKLIQKYGDERSDAAEFSRAYTADQHRRVLDLLADRFGEDIGVEEMANEAGLSSSHFSRMFKAVIGDAPYQFLTRYRAERAAEMLTDLARPVIDIALACGFSDQPHLTRVFKQIHGETPRRWRLAQQG
ncbi:MAG: AraC family transcriptional regulator [Henriciella sp.]|nr:AraC family transcriptional regulator [Henriciella sp.]